MCFQNLIQVYETETVDSESVSAVVVYAKLEKLGDSVEPQYISFDIDDAKKIGEALIKLHDDHYFELL